MNIGANHSFRLIDRGWEGLLTDPEVCRSGELKIICPFIKLQSLNRVLKATSPGAVQVITRFNLSDFCSGVSDLAALRLLLDRGAEIRGIRGLHAKVYLFGDKRVVAGSVNLTDAAMFRNHEFGFVADDPAIVSHCQNYFDELWSNAGVSLDKTRVDL